MKKTNMFVLCALAWSAIVSADIQLDVTFSCNSKDFSYKSIVVDGEKAVWKESDLLFTVVPTAKGEAIALDFEIYSTNEDHDPELISKPFLITMPGEQAEIQLKDGDDTLFSIKVIAREIEED